MKKRIFDLVVAAVALVVVAPVLLIAAIVIKLDSPGPVLYRSIRVGRKRTTFTLLKLRSMQSESDDQAPEITASGDSRITRAGRLCRKFKLDELPQLWNVVRGDMSLVGPRPENPHYVEWYNDQELRLLDWRPGITSPASVTFRDEEGVLARLIGQGKTLDEAYREVLTTKLAIELTYFPTATLRSDLRWIARTLTAIVN